MPQPKRRLTPAETTRIVARIKGGEVPYRVALALGRSPAAIYELMAKVGLERRSDRWKREPTFFKRPPLEGIDYPSRAAPGVVVLAC
jgi:hypothetical protein